MMSTEANRHHLSSRIASTELTPFEPADQRQFEGVFDPSDCTSKCAGLAGFTTSSLNVEARETRAFSRHFEMSHYRPAKYQYVEDWRAAVEPAALEPITMNTEDNTRTDAAPATHPDSGRAGLTASSRNEGPVPRPEALVFPTSFTAVNTTRVPEPSSQIRPHSRSSSRTPRDVPASRLPRGFEALLRPRDAEPFALNRAPTATETRPATIPRRNSEYQYDPPHPEEQPSHPRSSTTAPRPSSPARPVHVPYHKQWANHAVLRATLTEQAPASVFPGPLIVPRPPWSTPITHPMLRWEGMSTTTATTGPQYTHVDPGVYRERYDQYILAQEQVQSSRRRARDESDYDGHEYREPPQIRRERSDYADPRSAYWPVVPAEYHQHAHLHVQHYTPPPRQAAYYQEHSYRP